MGVQYYTTEEILKNRTEIKNEFNRKPLNYRRKGQIINYVLSNIPKNARMLDCACGDGKMAKVFADNGFSDIYLVDIDKYLPENLSEKFYRVDLCSNKLPFTDNFFDIILSVSTFEHLENPFFCLREIHRVLKEKGEFLLSIPSIFSFRSRIKFLKEGNFPSYGKANNHIFVCTRGIFEKTFLKYFNLVAELYNPGFIRIFGRKLWLPDIPLLNKLFGNNVFYILRKKSADNE